MPNWKKIITSGSDAQLNSLELNNGATGSFTGSFIGDGSQLTGITATSSPGGSDSQIQYNNGGTTSGATNFVYDDINQRVGIGTDSPSSKLEVRSEIATHQLISINRAASNTAALYIGNDNNNDGVIAVNNGELRIGKDISGNFIEHIRINPSGNVGIGNTSPSSKLEVTGNVAIGYTSAAPTNGMIVNGNVGIGTTSPAGALQICKNNGVHTELIIGAGDGSVDVARAAVLQKDSITGPYNFDFFWSNHPTNQSGDLNFYSSQNSGALVTFKNTGEVGIGTTSPDEKLEVNGNIRITGNGNIGFGNDSKVIEYIDQNNQSGAGWSGKDGIKLYGDGTVSNLALYVGHIQTQGASEIKGKLTVDQDINLNNSLLSNQQNTDVDTGTETVATVSSSTYDGAFFDYVIKKGINLRAGTVTAVHDGTNVSFTETSTQDLGNTTDIELSVDLSGGNIRLRATTTSDNWSIKTIIRAL